MDELEEAWPDPDRRDDSLFRCLLDVHRMEKPLTPTQARYLECLSHGLGERGTAEACGVTVNSVKMTLKLARRALAAKDTTHACCEALRQGLIH